MKHYDEMTLLQYVLRGKSGPGNSEISKHLVICESCRETVVATRYLVRSFDEAWELLPAEEYGRLHRVSRLTGLLFDLFLTRPDISDIACAWSRELAANAGITIEVLNDTENRMALSAPVEIPDGLEFKVTYSVSGVRTRKAAGIERELRNAGEMFSKGKVFESLKALEEASSKRGSATGTSVIEISRENKHVMRVTIDPAHRLIKIECPATEADNLPCLAAVLGPEGSEFPTAVSKMEKSAGGNSFEASFGNLLYGRLTLFVSPALRIANQDSRQVPIPY